MLALSSSLIFSRSILRTCKSNFCQVLPVQQAVSKLKQAIHKELEAEKENEADANTEMNELQKYFHSTGWSITHRDIEVEARRVYENYQISSYFSARSPPPVQENEIKAELISKDYSQTKVCIKRKDSKKMMIAHYCISSQHGPMLVNIEFADHRPQQVSSTPPLEMSEDFQGPNMNSLEFKVQQAVNSFLLQLGVSDEFLKITSSYGLAYEQKFYVEWLRDLQNIL